MLAQYVQPLFASPYGHLRAKAAWTSGLFADIRCEQRPGPPARPSDCSLFIAALFQNLKRGRLAKSSRHYVWVGSTDHIWRQGCLMPRYQEGVACQSAHFLQDCTTSWGTAWKCTRLHAGIPLPTADHCELRCAGSRRAGARAPSSPPCSRPTCTPSGTQTCRWVQLVQQLLSLCRAMLALSPRRWDADDDPESSSVLFLPELSTCTMPGWHTLDF